MSPFKQKPLSTIPLNDQRNTKKSILIIKIISAVTKLCICCAVIYVLLFHSNATRLWGFK